MGLDDEARIRRELRDAARAIDAEPDLGDLDRRRARVDRRRAHRLTGATLALLVLATVLTVLAVRGGDGPVNVAERAVPMPEVLPSLRAVALKRDFADGTSIHVVSQPGPQLSFVKGFAPWWFAPAVCRTDGSLAVVVAENGGPSMIHSVDRRMRLARGRVAIDLSEMTDFQGVRHVGVVVQTPPGAARVTGTLRGSTIGPVSDKVTEGVAVLALTESTPSTAQPVVTVDVFDRTGATIVHTDSAAAASRSFRTGDPASIARECVAPAELPEPGARQPVDPAAARTAISRTLSSIVDINAELNRFKRSRIADRSPGEAVQQLQSLRRRLEAVVVGGEPVEVVNVGASDVAPIDPELVDVVFADPETAYFSYRDRASNASLRFGEATLDAGRWKLTGASALDVAPQISPDAIDW